MSNTNERTKRENEARGILQYWTDSINSYLEEEEYSIDENEISKALATLEGLVLIYNVLTESQCEFYFNNSKKQYELEYFE